LWKLSYFLIRVPSVFHPWLRNLLLCSLAKTLGFPLELPVGADAVPQRLVNRYLMTGTPWAFPEYGRYCDFLKAVAERTEANRASLASTAPASSGQELPGLAGVERWREFLLYPEGRRGVTSVRSVRMTQCPSL